MLEQLNPQQQQLFHFTQMHALAKMNQQPPPYRICISGGAGTGKSQLIKCIFHQLTKIYAPLVDSADQITVLKVAPTGTAAFDIEGQTIHSALSIKVGSSKLTESELNTLCSKLSSL